MCSILFFSLLLIGLITFNQTANAYTLIVHNQTGATVKYEYLSPAETRNKSMKNSESEEFQLTSKAATYQINLHGTDNYGCQLLKLPETDWTKWMSSCNKYILVTIVSNNHGSEWTLKKMG